MLNLPKTVNNGKRARHFYSTKEEALDAAARLKDRRDAFGIQAHVIGPALAEQAAECAELLKPLGIPLIDAIRRFVAAETKLRASVTIEEATTAFRATKADDGKQATAYRLRAEKLVVAFKGRMIASITGEELQEHLDDTTGGPGAFNQNLRLVRAIWRWCNRPPRQWCELEATEHLTPRATVAGEIGTLTPKEARAVMEAAETHHPDCVIPFAIALFTGLRQQEIDRLTPGDITDEGINLPATSAKTKRRRFIQMPEPLAAWLAVYPIDSSVTPSGWERKQRAVRRLAGFRVWSNLVEPAAAPKTLPDWPANALRHTAATVAVAMGKPLEQLVFEHGHVGGLEMLRRHYVGAMPKKDAREIQMIGPKGTMVLLSK
jgi:integrase